MKKLFKALGTIAMLAVLLLSFAACDDLSGFLNKNDPDTYKPAVFTSYGADGAKYVLTVTRPGRAVLPLTPKAGDSYTLTITATAGATYTSTGQIINVYASTLTLKHTGTSVTFSVTVNADSSSGGTMDSITGDIPIDNSATVVPAPGELSSQPAGGVGPTVPSDGGNDTWSNVASFSQVDGSWKAQPSYSATIQGMTLSATTDNYIIAFDANIKTMSVSGSATTTITGGDINALWPQLKESLGSQRGSTVTFNDAAHSYTITYNNIIMTLTDSELTQAGLQINQDGSKLKFAMDGSIEVIYTKQSGTSPSAPDISLTGTTWKAEFEDIVEAGGYSTGGTYEIRGKRTFILKFTSASAWTMDGKVLLLETGEERAEESLSGTYTVSGNTVILHGAGMPANGLAGMISGNTLALTGVTFYKQ